MTLPPPDGSRDRRIEDPTNTYLVHPLSRLLLGPALRARVSANTVSVAGLLLGAGAAASFAQWRDWRCAVLGLALATSWLVADGLDGMVARATRTASPLGRILDGVCDHGVFGLIYVAVALSMGTPEAWALGLTAAAFHGVQSSLYEGERARYHRRVRGDAAAPPPLAGRNPLIRGYDAIAFGLDRATARFDAALRGSAGREIAARYGEQAAAPMRLQGLLTSNTRVLLLFAACLAGDPALFWWIAIGPLTLVAAAGIAWHRAVEARLLRQAGHSLSRPAGAPLSEDHTG